MFVRPIFVEFFFCCSGLAVDTYCDAEEWLGGHGGWQRLDDLGKMKMRVINVSVPLIYFYIYEFNLSPLR